jgi:membrane-associated phospholipid phosphatase
MRAGWLALLALGCLMTAARASGMELQNPAPMLAAADSAGADSGSTSAPADSLGSVGAPESATIQLGSADSSAADSSAAKGAHKHRTLGGRATHTAKAFVSDVGYVVTSPFRLKPTGLLLTAAGFGITALTYGYDDEIRRGFQRSRGNAAYDAAIDLGNDFVDVGFMPNSLPFWIGGAVIGTAFDVDPLQSVCLDVIESHMIAGGARNIAKFVIGRKHPFEGGRSEFLKHGTSAPSGHTSVMFEIATVLTRHTKGWPTLGRVGVGVASYGIATAVGMQRVDTDAHWASDCVAAAFQGVTVANTVVTRNQKRREKEGIACWPTLAPTIGPGGDPALAMVWGF